MEEDIPIWGKIWQILSSEMEKNHHLISVIVTCCFFLSKQKEFYLKTNKVFKKIMKFL